MAGQDAQISILARNLNLLHRSIHNFLLRRDDLELDGVCHVKNRRRASDLGRQTSATPSTSESWRLRSGVRGPTPEVCLYAAVFIFSAASSTSSIGPFM